MGREIQIGPVFLGVRWVGNFLYELNLVTKSLGGHGRDSQLILKLKKLVMIFFFLNIFAHKRLCVHVRAILDILQRTCTGWYVYV